MATTSWIKVALVAAIALVLIKLVHGRWAASRTASRYPQPFDGEWYDNDDDGNEEYDDEEEEGYGNNDDDDEGYGNNDDDDEGYGNNDGDDDDNEGYAEYAPGKPRQDAGMAAASVALLPKPGASCHRGTPDASFDFAPGNALRAQNFLDSSRFMGVNTQGSSNRHANHDLRSVPVIPRETVGPWSQSTMEADLLRKPLE